MSAVSIVDSIQGAHFIGTFNFNPISCARGFNQRGFHSPHAVGHGKQGPGVKVGAHCVLNATES